jgi:predicted Rossmann fold flavoprotein
MFPTSDCSQTVIECLLREARAAGVRLLLNHGVEAVTRLTEGGFEVRLAAREPIRCERLLLATGGYGGSAALGCALGHTLEAPVPSLFTFHHRTPWLEDLAGVSVAAVEASVPGTGLMQHGPLLVTHGGLSGPAILVLSAWGARVLHGLDYQFPLRLNWLPGLTPEAIGAELDACRHEQPARLVVNTPIGRLPGRLWERLVLASGLARDTRWAEFSHTARHHLILHLTRTEVPVVGKSLNQEEFVTCGGVRLAEVDFKTMASRICPGLYFAGELLDIDGITGGYNFQAAWTTGWIAGRAMAQE